MGEYRGPPLDDLWRSLAVNGGKPKGVTKQRAPSAASAFPLCCKTGTVQNRLRRVKFADYPSDRAEHTSGLRYGLDPTQGFAPHLRCHDEKNAIRASVRVSLFGDFLKPYPGMA
jgi:hypothetical protein